MDRIDRAAQMATEWWVERLQSGDKAKFAETLKPLIEEDLRARRCSNLECDYDPHGHLLTAVRAAGLKCDGYMFSARGILPQKHSLRVTPSVLEPKEGYGNWTDNILVLAE